MIVIGLTGGIGMGKSTVTAQCAILGAKTINADDIVHQLLQPSGAAYQQVADAFPEAVKGNNIDRPSLGKIVFHDPQKLNVLEAILHPLVIEAEENFVHAMAMKGASCVVLDIPLLFETGAQSRMDISVLVTAPALIQTQRVLKRPHMTLEKLNAIRTRQMPDNEKRQYADIIINTGLGKGVSMRQVTLLFRMLGL